MAKLDTEGSIYYHAILFLVFLISFVTLKNLNFEDFRDSPLLTDNQVTAVWILFIVMLAVVAWVAGRGYTIKTPEYATLGLFAMLLVSLGLFVIFVNLIWDQYINSNDDYQIGGLGTISMFISGLLVGAGMVAYLVIKFSEDKQQQWFVQAVKDTIDRMEVTEYRPRARALKSKRRFGRKSRKQSKKMKNKEPDAEPVETPMPAPQTTPTQASPSIQSDATGNGTADSDFFEAPKGANIVKCLSCNVPLKIPDVPTRPINIRCPSCGTITEITD